MKDKKQQIFWFLYGFIATLCILIFVIYYSSLFVHAQGPNGLPYVISKHQSLYTIQENSWYEDMITKTINLIGSHSWTSYIDYDSIIFRITDINTNTNTVYIYWVFNPYTDSMIEPTYNSFDVTLSSLQIKFSDTYVF